MITRANSHYPLYFPRSRQSLGRPRYVERHILHMNKLQIYFPQIIVPIYLEWTFQDVTCSNTLLWAGAAFLAAFWPYLLVYRCRIPSVFLTILTWYSWSFWNNSLHWFAFSIVTTGLLYFQIENLPWLLPTLRSVSLNFDCQCYDWASLGPYK